MTEQPDLTLSKVKDTNDSVSGPQGSNSITQVEVLRGYPVSNMIPHVVYALCQSLGCISAHFLLVMGHRAALESHHCLCLSCSSVMWVRQDGMLAWHEQGREGKEAWWGAHREQSMFVR